jgi:hypothetical protein
MSKTKRGWLAVAAVLALGMSGIVRADDSGGGDSGNNGMNPMYGDSYATLQGQGHNAGTPRMAPEGAFAAHEMEGQTTTPLIDQMRQTQARVAAQARHNWDAMVEKTHAMTQTTRTSMNTQGSTTGTTTTTAPSTASNLTGSTSAPSAAGPGRRDTGR